jgi:hypothetical protein
MRQRGRKSAASLTVVPFVPSQRPVPPDHLSKQEADEWRAIVDRLPANWFPRETQPLLERLCFHVCLAQRLERELRKYDNGSLRSKTGLQRFCTLGSMEVRETMTIISLMTKLRLTVQSRYKAERAATLANNAPTGRKPWESV